MAATLTVEQEQVSNSCQMYISFSSGSLSGSRAHQAFRESLNLGESRVDEHGLWIKFRNFWNIYIDTKEKNFHFLLVTIETRG